MALKQQAYDHPAYLTVQPIAFNHSSASPGRFQAATALIAKSVNASVFTAIATNNSTHVIWGAVGTSTTTLSVLQIGTGAGTGTAVAGTYAVGTNTLINVTGLGVGTTTFANGAVFGATMTGADGVVVSVGIEAYIVPGANLTV
jgi:hypothetical protein